MSDTNGRIPVVLLGWNTAGTGLTKVNRESFGPLTDQFEIHHVGIGYRGDECLSDGMHVYPTNLHGGDIYGTFRAKEVIADVRPRILIVHQDVWYFENYMKHFAPLRPDVKVLAQIPLDGCFVSSEFAGPLTKVDRVAAYTNWARSEFVETLEQYQNETGVKGPPVDVVGLGVDVSRFGPVSASREQSLTEAKARVFGESVATDDESFVVLNASRPTPRKRIDLTIRGFAEFTRGKPAGVKLCLHHAYMEDEHRTQILSQAGECGISDRLILNPLNPQGGPVSEEDLNLLYNACDIGINTATGEGWGLVSFEHAAAGAAQIVPGHSACAELWQGFAEIVEPHRWYVPEFSPLKMAEVSPESVAAALQRLYEDQSYREELATRGQKMAGEFRWAPVAEQWRSILWDLIS